jgi:hypothetical protein
MRKPGERVVIHGQAKALAALIKLIIRELAVSVGVGMMKEIPQRALRCGVCKLAFRVSDTATFRSACLNINIASFRMFEMFE